MHAPDRAREDGRRLPPWFRIGFRAGEKLTAVRSLIRTNKLHTVCQSASCPNRTECWNLGTATFMILGNVCTRGCRFCNVPKGVPHKPDADEPLRVADAVAALKLKYAVITSVTRDDLDDGGAALFAATIHAIRAVSPECRVEVLIPDFQGSEISLKIVLDARPDILSHNLETVPSLYSRVRPRANYERSLELLSKAGKFGIATKTGLMLGFGESTGEILEVLREVRESGCAIITLGQYLQPSKTHLIVEKYYHPGEFIILRDHALELGFRHVVSGPMVRSSYHAGTYGIDAS
jgi:lipoic acid synthetase